MTWHPYGSGHTTLPTTSLEQLMNENALDPVVGVVMGSDSDWPTMKAATEALAEFDVPFEADVVSAHRMPER